MPTCSQQRTEDVAEEYVRGELAEAEAQNFEEHCLECDACFERVRALQAVREVLAHGHVAPKRPVAWIAFALAAAAVFIVFIAVRWRTGDSQSSRRQSVAQVEVPPAVVAPPSAVSPRPTQPETSVAKGEPRPTEIAALADKSLPPFHPIQVRGASSDEHFESGMRAYVASDCTTAVDELQRVPRTSDRGEAAVLYAGACHYVLRNFNAAHQSLVQLATNQDSPLSEAARYYLAQVELAQDHRDTARRWLGEVVALHGDYEARARAQLREID
jgi:hypothetical protein